MSKRFRSDGRSSLAEVSRLRSVLAVHGLKLDLRGVTGGNQWNLTIELEGLPEARSTVIGVESGQVVQEIKRGVRVLLESYRERVEDAINRK